jgi:hypothetical protein
MFEHPEGRVCSVPAGWTDAVPADPYVSIGNGRSYFRVPDLVTLAALVAELKAR